MDPASGEPDLLEKVDALLTRHRTGSPPQQETAPQADRAAIPVLTDIVVEADTIPVLTDAVATVEANEPTPAESAPIAQAGADARTTEIAHDEEALRRIEEFLVREMENRIALEFTASLDRALNELLDRSREHIRHLVREALRNPPDDAQSRHGDSSKPGV